MNEKEKERPMPNDHQGDAPEQVPFPPGEEEGAGEEGLVPEGTEPPEGEAGEAPVPDEGGPFPEDGEPELPAYDPVRAAAVIESLMLMSAQPLSIDRIARILGAGVGRAQVREAIELLRAKYPPETSGILVEEINRGLQFRTNPSNQEFVRQLFDAKPVRFSRASLETLAIIAYKQPLTRLEMEQIRGVDCAGALKTLMERRLVRVVGKKDVPGKPFLFGTTREFMEVFGLGSLSDLPSLREIEDFLATTAGELVPDAPTLPFGEGGSAEEDEAPVSEEELAALMPHDGAEEGGVAPEDLPEEAMVGNEGEPDDQ